MSSAQWADQQRDRELVVQFKRFIVGSLIVHVVAISAALIFAQFNFRPDFDDSAMIVNFRGRPGPKATGDPGPRLPAPEPQAAVAAPAPEPKPKVEPAPKPEPKPAPKPEPKPEAKPEPKPEPKPAPRPDPKATTREVSPDKSKTDPKKADPKKTDPKAEPPKKTEPPPKPDPKTRPAIDLDAPVPPGNDDIALARTILGHGKGGVGNGPGGGGDWDGVKGYEGDGALDLYHSEEFWAIIDEIWKIPPDPTIGPDLVALVEIKVDNQGKILDTKIVRGSNNATYDRWVLKMFEELKARKDIPPPPKPSKDGYYILRYSLAPGQGT